jgi:hypothetical protein
LTNFARSMTWPPSWAGFRGSTTRALRRHELVLIERDLAEAFPIGLAVNKALTVFLRMEGDKLPNLIWNDRLSSGSLPARAAP